MRAITVFAVLVIAISIAQLPGCTDRHRIHIPPPPGLVSGTVPGTPASFC